MDCHGFGGFFWCFFLFFSGPISVLKTQCTVGKLPCKAAAQSVVNAEFVYLQPFPIPSSGWKKIKNTKFSPYFASLMCLFLWGLLRATEKNQPSGIPSLPPAHRAQPPARAQERMQTLQFLKGECSLLEESLLRSSNNEQLLLKAQIIQQCLSQQRSLVGLCQELRCWAELKMDFILSVTSPFDLWPQ